MSETLKQGVRFILAGSLALLVDASVLAFLTTVAAVDPFTSRALSIAIAIVFAYFAHRSLTFVVKGPPSLSQFGKFIGVAASVSVLNYLIYAAVLLFVPGATPALGFAIATGLSMFASFFGYRTRVFNEPKL